MKEAQREASRGTTAATDDRRRDDRIPGPFDGRRVGALETPIRIYDLSEGGCFITALHEQQDAINLVLKIELPYEGWITVKAQTIYRRPDFGFAVRFVDMTEETAASLARALEKLRAREPYDQ